MLFEKTRAFLRNNKRQSIIELQKIRSPNRVERLKILLSRSVNIPTMDLDITTVCNLRCRDCAKSIPYYKRPHHYEGRTVVSDLKRLLERVDNIYSMSIIGGEPFLNPDLPEILDFCDGSRQIKFIDIVTNGMAMPDEKVLSQLKESRILVQISSYNATDTMAQRRGRFIGVLERHGIKYNVLDQPYWKNLGDCLSPSRNFSDDELRVMYLSCPMRHCVVFRDGKLYHCGRAAFACEERGIVFRDEIVDVRSLKTRSEARRALRKFYSQTLPNYCQFCSNTFERIEAARQL